MALTWYLTNLLLILLGTILISYVWHRRNIYLLSWKIPGPIALPILGNALIFFCKNEDIFERATKTVFKYPSPMRFWFGPKFTIVFSKAEQIEKLITSPKFNSKDEVYRFIKAFTGEGLISSSGDKWRNDRKLMLPLFTKKNIISYFPQLLHHSEILVDVLQKHIDQPAFNVQKVIHRCVTDFINETVLGVQTKAQNGSLDQFLNHLKRSYIIVHARIIKVWLQIEWIFKLTHYWKDQEESKQVVHDFFRQVLKTARTKRNNKFDADENKIPSMLSRILDIKENFPNFANEKELIDHIATLYSASEDTTTIVTSFTLLLFGMYPEIQEKVVDEVFQVLGNKKRAILLEDISKLKYLEMCVKEVLRLFPVAPFIMRVASEEFQIDDLNIPKGCSVIMSIQNIHRDPAYWEKPNEFYPEHFLPEAIEKRHPYTFLAFSAGPRVCVGKTYAYMALLTLIATILQNYVIEADGTLEDIELRTDISVRTKNNYYPIRIKLRDLR